MKAISKTRRVDRRKSDIIQAALGCFNDLGYAETTMALIRKNADASTGSIYHHFQSKDQLAAAVYLEGILDYQEGYVQELEKHAGAKAGVATVISYHLAWVEIHPAWARYLTHMRHAHFMKQTEGAFQQANQEFIFRVGQWFGRQIKSSRLKKLPQEIFFALLMGPVQEYTRLWLAGHAKLQPSEAARHFAKAAWNDLKNP
jgi:AcrR family transcriptional regulator